MSSNSNAPKPAAIILRDQHGREYSFPSLYAASKTLQIPYSNIRRSKCEGRTSVNGFRVTFP